MTVPEVSSEQSFLLQPPASTTASSAPGIRVTAAALEPGEAEKLADALAGPALPPDATYAG